MAKPADISSFTSDLELLLARTWEIPSDKLNPKYISKTRETVTEIRGFYSFKRKMPSKINYKWMKYRAGYLASFGQRHAYLPYYQLNEIKEAIPTAIPSPNRKGELTITLMGGGAAIEVFGVLWHYNEKSQRVRDLNLMIIEKVEEWYETRMLVIKGLLKNFFPKVTIRDHLIQKDLRTPCYEEFAKRHDLLVNSDILMCYNVLNENEAKEQGPIIENISYLVLQNKKPLLTLLMEPAPKDAIPRIRPFKDFLAETSIIINDEVKEYVFNSSPLKIEIEEVPDGLNRRLFGEKHPKFNPKFYNWVRRWSVSATKRPYKINPPQFALEQKKAIRERQRGQFVKKKRDKRQHQIFSNWEP